MRVLNVTRGLLYDGEERIAGLIPELCLLTVMGEDVVPVETLSKEEQLELFELGVYGKGDVAYVF